MGSPPVHDTVEASLGDQVTEEESQPVIIPLMVSRS